jgi:hypothetical protein
LTKLQLYGHNIHAMIRSREKKNTEKNLTYFFYLLRGVFLGLINIWYMLFQIDFNQTMIDITLEDVTSVENDGYLRNILFFSLSLLISVWCQTEMFIYRWYISSFRHGKFSFLFVRDRSFGLLPSSIYSTERKLFQYQ